jgi:hypothetical protein
MYEPMKKTITHGVRMYSMLSASPVTMPPHGPMALRANEYAAPVCGSAGDISARREDEPPIHRGDHEERDQHGAEAVREAQVPPE